MSNFIAGKYNMILGKRTYIMAIINLTPDSFSDGGLYLNEEKAINRVFELMNLGADIIDIGAQSTRPGADLISEEEELSRLIPVLESIKGRTHIPISVDTFYPRVASKAIELGVDIINDVSGFKNSMIEAVKYSNCGCIVMSSDYGEGIRTFFEKKLNDLTKSGISKERICFDPGIGFGKTSDQNIEVIKNLHKLKIRDNAFLIGTSRKSFLNKYGGGIPAERIFSTIATNVMAAERGADILRVHDVGAVIQAIRVADDIIH